MGAKEVRLLLGGKRFNAAVERLAVEWLAEKDREASRLVAASQVEMAVTASHAVGAAERAALAAKQANVRATIALVIAIVGIIIAVAWWLLPRH